MARAYSDDLRRKILQAYGRGSGSLEELAQRFGVSHGYTKKIRKQQLRSGQMERVPQRYGTRSRTTPEIRAQLREMTRRFGRAPCGERVREATPAGHWRTLTLLGAMTTEGLLATMTVESPTDGDVFLAYLDQVLCPRLQPRGHG